MNLTNLKDFGFIDGVDGTMILKVLDDVYFKVYNYFKVHDGDEHHEYVRVDFGTCYVHYYKKEQFNCLHCTYFDNIENALAYIQWHRTNAIEKAIRDSRLYNRHDNGYSYWKDMVHKYKEGNKQ